MAESPDLLAVIEALRGSGAAERDSVRFACLDALARRAAGQAEPIRQKLDSRIRAIASELAACPATAPAVMTEENAARPLAELLAYISQQAHAPLETVQAATADVVPRKTSQNASADHSRQGPELKSVAYYRNTWSKLSTEQQLTQTLAQAPENAGPMNSQHLVLRSLQVMRDIAPEYLQGFMSYIDTLIWLEHVDPAKLAGSRSSSGEGGNKKTRPKKRS